MAKKTIQGIKYLLDASKRTAEVIANNYNGKICIPQTVVDNNIKYNVTSIGDHAFCDCYALTSVTIPNSVTSIGSSAFSGCSSLTSVNIPKSVTNIGSSAFSGCSSITSIVVGSGNTIYDSRNNCNAIIETATNTLIAGCQNTVIPNSVTSIGYAAFSGCSSLTSITIPNSVTNIRQSAFRNCKQLNSITIPNSITNIGYWAFANCKKLKNVTIEHNFTGIGDVFDGAGRSGNHGRPLKETERKKRNEPIILAIELFLNALNSYPDKQKPHDYEYLLGQTIRQYEPAENHQHVSVGAWNHWKKQAHSNEDIRQFQFNWKYTDKDNKSIQFNEDFIQEHTTPVADIKEKLKKLINKNSRSIKKILEQMHISRILKTENKAIKKNRGRGLNFEEIANSTVCYLGAGIEFQCSEDKIGYEAFNGCDNLQILKIGGKFICRTKIDQLIKGEKITI